MRLAFVAHRRGAVSDAPIAQTISHARPIAATAGEAISTKCDRVAIKRIAIVRANRATVRGYLRQRLLRSAAAIEQETQAS